MKLYFTSSVTSKYCKPFVVVSLIVLLQSCATHLPQYNKNKGESIKAETTDTTKAAHTFYLIGDAGNASDSTSNNTLLNLEKRLKKAVANSTLIFLGDNIYPTGMPTDKMNPEYTSATKKITIKVTQRFLFGDII